MTKELEQQIKDEAYEHSSPYYSFQAGGVAYDSYIAGATKYAEEVERLRDALEKIAAMDAGPLKFDSRGHTINDFQSIAQQALTNKIN